jgi:RimJ/RimL family protein N-acetyltransferase
MERAMDLHTGRLRLRPWAAADLEALHRLWSDPLTIWWGPHTGLEETRALLARIQAEGGWWAVEHRGEVVGNVFLRPSRREEGALELGYHLRSDRWGQGFATEAAAALLATSGGKAVEAPVVPGNLRSQRVLAKLGFSPGAEVMHAGRPHVLWRSPPATRSQAMLKTTCHCGAVTVELPRAPETLTDCDCSICRRYGTLWAYFRPSEVRVVSAPGATSAYAWGERSIQFVRCATCGCVTHWEPTTPGRPDRMGVNARNFTPGQLGDFRIRRLDGAGTEQYLDQLPGGEANPAHRRFS